MGKTTKKNIRAAFSCSNNIRMNGRVKNYEKSTMPSETIQGEAFTIQELYMRAARSGQLHVNENNTTYWDTDLGDEMLEFMKVGKDLTDYDAMAKHINRVEAKLKTAKENADRMKKEQDFETELQKREALRAEAKEQMSSPDGQVKERLDNE